MKLYNVSLMQMLKELSSASDDEIRTIAYQYQIEVLTLVDLLYLRAHLDAPRIGPLGPPWDGLKSAGVVVGRRQTECGCVIHSSDDHLVDVAEMLSGPTALVDVDDVAAWRAAELRVCGDPLARVELREDVKVQASFGYVPSSGSRHYQVVVVRGDGGEERFP